MASPLEIHPKDAFPTLHDPAYVWVDIREDEEWDYGHLPGIKHIPMSRMTPESFAPFPKDQKIILICRTGGRSMRAVYALRDLGFVNAQSLSGGMMGMNTVLEKHIPVLMH